MISTQQVKDTIQAKFPDAKVEVVGDGEHFEAIVVATDFAGVTKVKQHQMIYGALQAELASEAIHAISLKTYTPEAWQAIVHSS
jgi:acid stress-induced BolA-like protein IbaG/YrbA